MNILGIMIPPSVPLVIYAILTQESIGKLFMAAVLPGIIAMLGYMLVIRIIVALKPSAGPAGPPIESIRASGGEAIPRVCLFRDWCTACRRRDQFGATCHGGQRIGWRAGRPMP